MIILIVGILLLGAVFGWFFSVWILAPTCAMTFVIFLACSIDAGQGLLRALLEFGILATSLQIGYVTGLLSGVTVSKYLRKPGEASCAAAPIAAARHQHPT